MGSQWTWTSAKSPQDMGYHWKADNLGFLMVYSLVYNSPSGPNRGPRTSTDWTAGLRAENPGPSDQRWVDCKCPYSFITQSYGKANIPL